MPPRKESNPNDEPLNNLIDKFDQFLTNHATTTAQNASSLQALQETLQQQLDVTSKLLTTVEKQPEIPRNFSFGSLHFNDSPTSSSKQPPKQPLTTALPPPKIHLPQFDGSNPLDWLFQANNYFDFFSIPHDQRLSLTQFYFTNDALSWFKYLAKNDLLTDWSDFSRALELRFGPSTYANHQASLFKLSQITTVTAYVTEFERLSNYVVGLPPEALLNCFLSGLRQDIQQELSVLKPTSFQQAVGLAKLLEDKHQATVVPLPTVAPSFTSNNINSALLSPPPTTVSAVLPAPSTNSLPTARLSPDQLQQRRAAGLCFRCPEKYVPGHRCNPPQFLLIIDNSTDTQPEPPLVMPEANLNVPSFLAISPASFFGLHHTTSMRLSGFINDHPVSILVDSGSTHNLIQPHVASMLHLPVQHTTPFPVFVGNGEPLQCAGFCPNLPLALAHTMFPIPLFLLAFKGCELILGFDWLRSLGQITADFGVQSLSFRYNNKIVTLQGNPSPLAATSGVKITDLEDKVASQGVGIDTTH